MSASRWSAGVVVVGVVLALSGCSGGAGGAADLTAAPRTLDTASPDGCRPAEVYPLRCGTFRSTYGGSAIRGSRGGPVQDRLEISFTRADGQLRLLARDGCWTATVPMRFVTDPSAPVQQRTAERSGVPRIATSGCATRRDATGSWAFPFLHSALRTTDAETFGRNATSVFFEYQGAAAIGAPQPPRNELRCVAAHIEPFSCGGYESTRGSGTLGFLGSRPFRLTFAHVNGELTASFFGRCNGLSTGLQVDGGMVVATGGASTTMGCDGTRGGDDSAVVDFFRGPLGLAVDQDKVTFTSPSGSATFRR